MKVENSFQFDNELKNIAHYKIHPEMMPFVGAEFEKNRILIISESHYLPPNLEAKDKSFIFNEWYNSSETTKKTQGYTDTRGVINNINENKGHRIFINLQNALNERGLDLNCVAWYNFFQRPAEHKNGIKHNDNDIKSAQEVFESLIEILKPELVIFVSMLSFGSIQKSNNKKVRFWNPDLKCHIYKNLDTSIQYTCHPNAIQWHTKSYKINNKIISGKEKFVSILNRFIEKKKLANL